ncbi:uncharacterized protein LOC135368420 [Ornithodoros turicata]|uniref:uncharacterized protein LOC135368420 n=1 Tax=Ornithodoros turicata TaxID=34597 RepID=UPI003139451E
MWPIQLLLNELPFDIRFHELIVGALWFGIQHPPAHLFIKTFVDAFNNIGSIPWQHAGRTMMSHVYAVCCCVDSAARAALLNMKQFNGYFGCSWCLEEGTVVDGVLRYIPSRSPAPARTHRSLLNDMQEAFQRGVPSHGVKGPSPLIQLPGFNLVWCVPPDVMHCVLEGVTRQLTELWLSAVGQAYYIGRHIRELDDSILKMRPPMSFCRLPRRLSDRAHWKATEWMYWLLFYSLPCLRGVLPTAYFNHFTMLCQAVFTLLQASVTDANLEEAEELLSSFVARVYTLYGASAATFNVHQLLHITKSVEMLGPLWGTSTFPFENGNGQLVKLVKAAQGVPLQIAERCIMKSWLSTAAKFVELSPSLQSRKSDIVNAQTIVQIQACVLGAPLLSMQVSSSVEELFIEKYGRVPSMTHYSRFAANAVKFHTTSYARATKTCSSCVKMRDGSYCLLSDICSALLETRKILLVSEEIILSECRFPNVNICISAIALLREETSSCIRKMMCLLSACSLKEQTPVMCARFQTHTGLTD